MATLVDGKQLDVSPSATSSAKLVVGESGPVRSDAATKADGLRRTVLLVIEGPHKVVETVQVRVGDAVVAEVIVPVLTADEALTAFLYVSARKGLKPVVEEVRDG